MRDQTEIKQAEMSPHEKLLRKKEVAIMLACSPRHIDRLVSAGELARVKVLGAVRFRMSEVRGIMQGGAA